MLQTNQLIIMKSQEYLSFLGLELGEEKQRAIFLSRKSKFM